MKPKERKEIHELKERMKFLEEENKKFQQLLERNTTINTVNEKILKRTLEKTILSLQETADRLEKLEKKQEVTTFIGSAIMGYIKMPLDFDTYNKGLEDFSRMAQERKTNEAK